MTPEDKLNRLFAAQTPPARDLAFEIALAERIALRRAWATAGTMVPWAIAATAALWGLQPVIGVLGETLGQILTPTMTALTLGGLTAVSALALNRRFNAG
ncbi:MAG: hypothetical protein J0M36_02560 [Caulobacterales bacterium]|nr:hypothetical protein [Caulobacterales bacterium]